MFVKTLRRGLLAASIGLSLSAAAEAAPVLSFTKLWTYEGGGEATAEIVAYDNATQRSFVTNAADQRIDVLDQGGNLVGSFDVSAFGSPNSVAVKNGVVAVAVENGADKQSAGEIWFFDAGETNFAAPTSNSVTVGALPDMVTFTPDGSKVLVANEGEPNDDYTVDPEGSISVIDISAGVAGASVTNLGFGAFSEAAIEADGGRIFGPNASVAQDLEPEYITVSPDGTTAFVTLQENNAVAKVDLTTNTITEIQGLGYKDHSLDGNEMDASNKDDEAGNLQNWPVLGMYQPDSIASYEKNGQLYYVTANEGDARDYDGYSEEGRVKDLDLDLNDDGVADGGDLQDNDQLGRLKTTFANGDTDGDGLYEQIYSFGARSFSIWDENGGLVYDSGSLIEELTLALRPELFNNDEGDVDDRSDDKGPEPEALTIAQIGEWVYALVGLERTGGFMVFDITDPNNPVFQQWILEDGDLSPEGIVFALTSLNSAGGTGIVAVANEVSGTTTFYRVSAVPVPGSLALLAGGLLALRRSRRKG